MVSGLIFAHKHEVREIKVLQRISEGADTWQVKSSGTVVPHNWKQGCVSTRLDEIFWFVCLKLMLPLGIDVTCHTKGETGQTTESIRLKKFSSLPNSVLL